MSGRELARDQVLRWRENWSWDDRRSIEEHLDRLGVSTFNTPRSGDYVRCYDPRGKLVMCIAPGWVEFTRGNEPDTVQPGSWRGYALSTFRPHSGSRPGRDRPEKFCLVHGLPERASGLCDTCADELS